VLGYACVFDRMESESYQWESIGMFYFFAWMSNPDLLPRMKTVTFFSEIAGRSSFGFGPPPAKSPLSSPPAGVDICLLIHLDHYVDWMPQTTSSFTSGVSGLPSSSSGSAPGRSFPFFRRFSWTTGVANGQAGAQPLRMLDPCRRHMGGDRSGMRT
jgi:hypothetical protein